MIKLIGSLKTKQTEIQPNSDSDNALVIKNSEGNEKVVIRADGKWLSDLDLNNNDLLNSIVNGNDNTILAKTGEGSPQGVVSGTVGEFYYDKTNNDLYVCKGGTDWQKVSSGLTVWGSIIGTLSDQTDLQTALDGKLNLDQTTPQTITNGIPLLSSDRNIDELHELVDKKYVDEAVTSLGIRYYMTDTSDPSGYKLCTIAVPTGVEKSYTKSNLNDDDYVMGWISAINERPAKLVAGVYNWHMISEKTSGSKTLRLYWKLVERKSNNSEIVIATSATSNIITSKASYEMPLVLSADYQPEEGSRIVGKIYADVSGGGTAPEVTLYYEGTTSSHWEIPANTEVLQNMFVPYTGATQNVDLGSKNLTTTGTITSNVLKVGTAYTFPTSDGSAGQFIKTDGSGNLSWASGSGGSQTPWLSDIDADSHYLYKLAGIKDSASTPKISINSSNRKLYASDGTTFMLDWSTAGTVDLGDNNLTTTGTGTFGTAKIYGDSNNDSLYIGENASVGWASVAVGKNASAGSDYATAVGVESHAGEYCTVVGMYAYASSVDSVSIGYDCNVPGPGSVGIGRDCYINGSSAVAIGHSSYVDGSDSVAIGNYSSGHYLSVAIGGAAYAQSYATAIGSESSAYNYASVALGRNAHVGGAGAVGLGYGCYIGGDYSIGIGFHSFTSDNNEIDIANQDSTYGNENWVGGYSQLHIYNGIADFAKNIIVTQRGIVIGDIEDPEFQVPGTIKFTNGHFYGYNGNAWVQLDNT